jgi:hypothetical protein
MRYWWVNQNQTYKFEVPGGFTWSPFKNANGARNPFYETMDEVQPGDLVFSYTQQQVKAIVVAQKWAYYAPKPASFENASELNPIVLEQWDIANTANVGAFKANQGKYLEFHRDVVFQG